MILPVLATAYCLSGTTSTGGHTDYGIVAVDPRVIPLHSRIVIHHHVFLAEDTGAYVLGRHVDIYMHDCSEASRYFRRIQIEVKR